MDLDEQLTDPSLQRKIQITSLLQHGGFKIWQEMFDELKECYKAEKDALLVDSINSEKLALLNYRLGKFEGVNAVQAILDELLEEISPSDGVNSEDVDVKE